ncbi:hypothetical protein [Brevibacillus laterosporus]|uniref:Uncharacterized protein n=1 Tax=Brevibacillus laterosporus TaxID=1465 RepID=A0AAP8QG78_BRELA|nr:hypothetical protein [Brevibacillus laterosporus]PPB10890.1 hypothetical protein C4A77_04500 [Brevibacillus laterosporus]
MTALEKIELINTLHDSVVGSRTENDCCVGVLVPLNKKTIKVLKQLGVDYEWIRLNRLATPTDGYFIDLVPVAIRFSSGWTRENGFQPL